MSKLVIGARILLGLLFAVFGAMGLFQLVETPPMEGDVAAFMAGLVATGYFMTLLKLTETVCGLLLLIGRYVPLALTVLAPVVLNILLFHVFLAPDPQGLGMAIVILVLEIFLAWAYRDSFRGVLAAKATPSA